MAQLLDALVPRKMETPLFAGHFPVRHLWSLRVSGKRVSGQCSFQGRSKQVKTLNRLNIKLFKLV
jgi:hypothetical protein